MAPRRRYEDKGKSPVAFSVALTYYSFTVSPINLTAVLNFTFILIFYIFFPLLCFSSSWVLSIVPKISEISVRIQMARILGDKLLVWPNGSTPESLSPAGIERGPEKEDVSTTIKYTV